MSRITAFGLSRYPAPCKSNCSSCLHSLSSSLSNLMTTPTICLKLDLPPTNWYIKKASSRYFAKGVSQPALFRILTYPPIISLPKLNLSRNCFSTSAFVFGVGADFSFFGPFSKLLRPKEAPVASSGNLLDFSLSFILLSISAGLITGLG